MTELPLWMIAVAPNGARKTKADHPSLPITPDELAKTALQCLEAGACMIHLHVRNHNHGHSLDVDRYKAAISTIQARIGADMIIQISTEAVGLYNADQQMQLVRDLRPEAVSLAIRELCPHESDERKAAAFFEWLHTEKIAPQYILYSPEDVMRFNELRQRGLIPGQQVSVLYVLGRYKEGQNSLTQDLLPMLATARGEILWSVCAFGASEAACLLTAAGLGGHCRVGFENNMKQISGDIAPDNATLVAQIANYAVAMGRRVASPIEARALLGMV